MESLTLDVKPLSKHPKNITFGVVAALITVTIWSIYFISLRVGALSPLTPEELAIFRYSFPGFLLSPILWRYRVKIIAIPALYLFGIVLGAGLPFFLLSAWGIRHGNVLQASTLIPGAAPLFVSLLTTTVFKQKIDFWRVIGLIFITLGILVFLAQAIIFNTPELLYSLLIFIFCAFLWAIFTLSLRQAHLSPVLATALVTASNGLAILLWVFFTKPQLGILNMQMSEVLTQLMVQGIVVGVFSGYFYGYAILRIGAESTSAVGSLTPVLASILAWTLLGDQISVLGGLALTLTTIGVLSASGVMSKHTTLRKTHQK